MEQDSVPKPMDLRALREDIVSDAEDALAIMEQTEYDIVTDDYQEYRIILYHLIQPTIEWLSERFFWAPSVEGNTTEWTKILVEKLLETDPNMFICLNRIVILHEREEDEAAVLALYDVPDLEMPDYQGVLGLKWTYMSSVVINLTAVEASVREVVEAADREGDYLDYETEMKYGFAGTLLHEIRHLGLEGNPYLPEEDYPQALFSEEEVEQWARSECDRIFGKTFCKIKESEGKA